MNIATDLSRVSGMFRCDRTETIASHADKMEELYENYGRKHQRDRWEELLISLKNYNPHKARKEIMKNYRHR